MTLLKARRQRSTCLTDRQSHGACFMQATQQERSQWSPGLLDPGVVGHPDVLAAIEDMDTRCIYIKIQTKKETKKGERQ